MKRREMQDVLEKAIYTALKQNNVEVNTENTDRVIRVCLRIAAQFAISENCVGTVFHERAVAAFAATTNELLAKALLPSSKPIMVSNIMGIA